MRFAGIDVAAGKPIAVATISDVGVVTMCKLPVSDLAGAQRLVEIRESVLRAPELRGLDGCVVEIPYGPSTSFLLPSISAVVFEAVASVNPGAYMVALPCTRWRKLAFGKGNMKTVEAKEKALEVAGPYGADGDDDIAEALCMALVARDLS